ncbi:uncharacterized protein [Amphiura filiformis]|uniref:uncharacterized protein isoform X2 n=1 Tax=Amphiura filiformis TaxID=82378 RepID=UPI003B21084C
MFVICMLLYFSCHLVAAFAEDAICPNTGPLGMESGIIKDDQLKASSIYDGDGYSLPPEKGRLNNARYWATEHKDKSSYHWIQVAFQDLVTVAGVQTQGGGDFGEREWVKKLQIQSGDSENSLTFIMEEDSPKTFAANTDINTIVNITFSVPITTRYLRIVPTDWKVWVALRFEVIGCRTVVTSSQATTTSAKATTNPYISTSPTGTMIIGVAVGSSIALMLIIISVLCALKLIRVKRGKQTKPVASTAKPTEVNQPYYLSVFDATPNHPSDSSIKQPVYVDPNQENPPQDELYHDITESATDDDPNAIYYSSVESTSSPQSNNGQVSDSYPKPQTKGKTFEAPEDTSLYYASSDTQKGVGWEENAAYDSFSNDDGDKNGGNDTEGWEDNTFYNLEDEKDENSTGWKDNDIYAGADD